MSAKSPLDAIALYEDAIQSSHLTPREHVALLEGLADARSHAKQHAAAADARRDALQRRLASASAAGTRKGAGTGTGTGPTTTVADAVAGYAALAKDLQAAARYDEALAALAAARAVPGFGADAASNAVLLKLESGVHDCAGDAAAALLAFEQVRLINGWCLGIKLHIYCRLSGYCKGATPPPRTASSTSTCSSAPRRRGRARRRRPPWRRSWRRGRRARRRR